MERISEKYIGDTISRLDALQKLADILVIKPESYYHNWPPPPQRTKAEIEKLVYSSDLYQWIEALLPTDEIKTFCDNTPLAGAGGYVAFRNGDQVTVYEEWVS